MKLSRRLETIVNMVPKCTYVADIGCDHAYVAMELVQRGRAARVLACDVREGPLAIAARNVQAAGLGGQVTLRLGDGLAPVEPGEAETAVIAGMGGELMMRILSGRLAEFRHLVLSPQSELAAVRHFLEDGGFRITDEAMVLDDGKYYTVLVAEPETVRGGKTLYTDACEYVYGRLLLARRDPVLLDFLRREMRRYAEILKHTQKEGILQECDLCIRAMKMYQDKEITVAEITGKLEAWAPRAAACEWDNPGLLVGRGDRGVERVYVALDATVDSVSRAIEAGCELMVTHHPMIFKAVKQINDGDALGRKIMDLVRNDVSLFAMHTNFDACPGGMADLVCRRLGMERQGVLEEAPVDEEGYGIGFTAELEAPMECAQLAALVKERFGLAAVSCADAGGRIRRVAVCPGSGRGLVRDVIRLKPDVFITGDMGHHEALDLMDEGISLIDAGHFGLEHIFVEAAAAYLEQAFPALEVLRDEAGAPFEVLQGTVLV